MKIILILLALLIFSTYIGITLKWFGIPKSISMTYYLLEEKKKNLGWWFTATLISCALLIMPFTITALPENFQVVGFFAPAAIAFIGAAPQFKLSLDNKVHMTSAVIAVICTILWCVFFYTFTLSMNVWFSICLLLLILIGVMIGAYFTKSIKFSYIYWIEIWAFGNLILGLIINLFIK